MVPKQCKSGRPIVGSYFQNVIGWRTSLERDKVSTRRIVWGENYDGRFFCKNEVMAQKMFLPLLRSIKRAKIGPIVASVKCQKRGSIINCSRTHFVGTGSVSMDLLRSNRMGRVIQDVDIAKLGIEVGNAIKKKKSILTLSSVRDRVTHERPSDSLTSIRRVSHNPTNSPDA